MSSDLSPTPGLLWGFTFRDSLGTRLTNERCAEALAAPHDWVWMHFALADHRARRFLDAFAAAPAQARALLTDGETRPQLHLGPAHAFGILPDLEKDFDGQSLGEGRLAFFLDEAHLLTVRRHALRAVDDVREEVEAGLALAGPPQGFVHIVARYLAIVEDRLQRLTHDLDRLEDQVLADRDDVEPARLGPLRRELSRHRREFAGLRGALARAVNARSGHGASAMLAPLLDRDAAGAADRARLLFEEMDARIAARTNRSLSTLTVLSTLLLPPTFIAGAFGMNLNGIPWASGPLGFWWATGLCIGAVAAGYWLLRRYRIL